MAAALRASGAAHCPTRLERVIRAARAMENSPEICLMALFGPACRMAEKGYLSDSREAIRKHKLGLVKKTDATCIDLGGSRAETK